MEQDAPQNIGIYMLDDSLVILALALIAGAGLIGITLFVIQSRSEQSARIRERRRAYEDLLHAMTALSTAGADPYRLDQAKMALARTLNRLNLIASPEVLAEVNGLLDFLNQYREGEVEVLKSLNILNAIVLAAREEIDPASAKVLEEGQFRFRFYSPRR